MLAQLPCLGLSLTLRFTKFELLRLNGQCGGVKKQVGQGCGCGSVGEDLPSMHKALPGFDPKHCINSMGRAFARGYGQW